MGHLLPWRGGLMALALATTPLPAVELVEEYPVPVWWSVTLKVGVVPGISSLHAQGVDDSGQRVLDRRQSLEPDMGTQVAVDLRWQYWWAEDAGFSYVTEIFRRQQRGTSGDIEATMTSIGVEVGVDALWGPPGDLPFDAAIGPRVGLGRAAQSESGMRLMDPGNGYLLTYGLNASVILALRRAKIVTLEVGYQGFVASTERSIGNETMVVGNGIMTATGHGLVANVGFGYEF